MIERWTTKAVGDVCRVVGGGTPPKDQENFYKGSIPWATVRDMRQDIISETEFQITEQAVKSSSTNVIPANNVVIATRVGLGKVCFVERDTAINQDLCGVLPIKPEALSAHFLFWWFKSVAHLIKREGTGATVQGVKLSFIRSLQVPIPPLGEQKRIIAILDETFEGIDTAIANAEKNLANAHELLSSYVARTFEKSGNNWQKSTIGAEVSLLTGFAFRSQSYTNDGSGVRLLRGDNIVQGKLRWDDAKRWPGADRAAYRDYELAQDDIVLAMDRTWIKAGIKFARISQADTPALLVQRVARMRCGPTLSNGFLFHLLGSKEFKKYVLDIQTGLGVPHISGKQIQAFRFERPDISTQKRILEKMEAVRTRSESLVANYECKLTLLDELKRSILQKAFGGELTARDVDAAREAAE